MKTLDMRGQPCPIPVIKAKEALSQPGADGVVVLVDNEVAMQNLQKMASGLGYGFSHQQNAPGQWAATILLGGAAPPPANLPVECAPAAPAEGGLVVLITTNQMGTGAEELGKILIKGFIFSLTQLPTPPQHVIFLNGGAQLTVQGANTLEDLNTLAANGTGIFTCGTCLNYYGLTDQLAVGEITDMMGITQRLAAAGRLITI